MRMAAKYELFLNRLVFTEDGQDNLLNAEHYVMLGNYDRDKDRFETMRKIAAQYLKSLGAGKRCGRPAGRWHP